MKQLVRFGQCFTKIKRNYCSRPDIDFDFLLNDTNLDLIKQNIVLRKGVGDIYAVRAKWAEIQTIISNREKPKLTEVQYKKLWDEAIKIPNMSLPDVPQGGKENSKEVTSWGVKREGSCITAEKLVRSWRTLLHPTDASGQRSYAFLGALANLEKALLDYVFDRVCVLGFEPVTVPDIVPMEITEACGISQRTNQHMQYFLSNEPSVALSGTAEMGIASLLKGRVFDEEQLPFRLVSLSRCYRPEISHSASEAKLYRVHEFNKVEMFTVCTPEQSQNELDYLVKIQRGTFESLGIHCRLMEMPTEELGASAARKMDIEAWMPGRALYGEISSASNCTDYQSRRLGLRYKTKMGKLCFVHTCNGTAIASTRALISILETFQTDRKGLAELPDVISKRMKALRSPALRFQISKPFS